ncbi:MAG: hypothetical protein AAF125_11315, partial [Chloroflexota bacterium]
MHADVLRQIVHATAKAPDHAPQLAVEHLATAVSADRVFVIALEFNRVLTIASHGTPLTDEYRRMFTEHYEGAFMATAHEVFAPID